ncbi:MAG: L-threonylcarbamoyladenylate synthase [Draconibacterium sp.]|nr:L-threonylcarbamoyladenylate synthase [Draconibacterium sp.]
MTLIGKDIETAVALLNSNQVIAIPTETVYGLAGNALNPSTVENIYKIKNRPFKNPLIIHLPDTTQINKYVKNIPALAEKLAEHFWPGPLTLLLPKNDIIPDIVTAGLPNVAVRIPSHPIALQLLRKLSFPLAAPSANPFGYISPTSAEDVKSILFGKIDYILDGGICQKGIESTIIGFQNNQAILYRHGSISVEEIESVTGRLIIAAKNETTPDAPGMLSKHYAPYTKTFLTNDVKNLIRIFSDKKIGLLLFNQKISDTTVLYQEILSPSKNLKQAASNLYAALHRLDKCKLDMIIAERLPDEGLGKTINDRLERATK